MAQQCLFTSITTPQKNYNYETNNFLQNNQLITEKNNQNCIKRNKNKNIQDDLLNIQKTQSTQSSKPSLNFSKQKRNKNFLKNEDNLLKNFQTFNVTHTWTILNFNVLTKNTNSTTLYSNTFTLNSNKVKFSLRIITNYKNEFVALFLIMNKNDNHFKNFLNNKIEIEFCFNIKINKQLICTSKIKKKTFLKNENCHGFKKLLKMTDFKNLKDNDKVTVEVQLKNIFETTNFKSSSTTKAPCFLTHFTKIITINNFANTFFETENPIESEEFYLQNNFENQFSFVVLKEKNNLQKETGYISIYLKHSSAKFTIKNINWKISILSWEKNPFVTSEGTTFLTSNNFVIGLPKFILKKDLFDPENNLLPNNNLTLYVEINLDV